MLAFRIKILVSLFLSLLATSTAFAQCKTYAFLEQGFNMANYKACSMLLKQCEPTTGVVDTMCISNVMSQNPVCTQLAKLATVLHGNPPTITAEEQGGGYTLIDQFFSADGQHSYFIISPKGCLVDTNIDPLNLDATLKSQYRHLQTVTVTFSKPEFQSMTDGSASVIAIVKVTQNCLACSVLGFGTIRFDFDKDGKLIKTHLVKFSKDNK